MKHLEIGQSPVALNLDESSSERYPLPSALAEGRIFTEQSWRLPFEPTHAWHR